MKDVTHDELREIVATIQYQAGGSTGWLDAILVRPYDFPAGERFPIDDAKTGRMKELADELERLAHEFYGEVHKTRCAAREVRPPEPVWKVVYRSGEQGFDAGVEYEGEPQPAREMALWDVGFSVTKGEDIPLRLIGPDGSVELEGQALIDAGAAYWARLHAEVR